jgi:hypothetical protein
MNQQRKLAENQANQAPDRLSLSEGEAASVTTPPSAPTDAPLPESREKNVEALPASAPDHDRSLRRAKREQDADQPEKKIAEGQERSEDEGAAALTFAEPVRTGALMKSVDQADASFDSYVERAQLTTGTRPDLVVRLDVANLAYSDYFFGATPGSSGSDSRDVFRAAIPAPAEPATEEAATHRDRVAGRQADVQADVHLSWVDYDKSTRLVMMTASPKQIQDTLAALQKKQRGLLDWQTLPLTKLAAEQNLSSAILSDEVLKTYPQPAAKVKADAKGDSALSRGAAATGAKESRTEMESLAKDKTEIAKQQSNEDTQQLARGKLGKPLAEFLDETNNATPAPVLPKAPALAAAQPSDGATAVNRADKLSGQPRSLTAQTADQLSFAGAKNEQVRVLFIIRSLDLPKSVPPSAAPADQTK